MGNLIDEGILITGQRAIGIKEAAALLQVSYGTVYAHKEALGFFQIGSVWRVWPEKLRQTTSDYNKRRPAQTEQEKQQCPSESTPRAVSTLSTSAHQAAKEFADLVKRRTEKKRRNITTG
ncbi:hypothetical protein P3T23_009601 [Paraburkholderia sp. GAS448]|uniref:hypothetical protein n=1 Tax=Paraburkholderia sp. GAS448 TaxID=3035136 RepID=UPI003D1B2FFD